MAVDVGTATAHLDMDTSGFVSGLKTAQTQAAAAMASIESTSAAKMANVTNALSSVGGTLSSLGTKLTVALTVPLAGVAAAGLKVASDFEAGMSQVKAISGATGDEFNALREKAIQLGADTAFSSSEVAEAMTEMAKAGWSSQQILDGMGGVLDAAAASGENLGTVSTIVADAITGFGLEAKESSRVADLLTQSANAGTISISDLGESYKYIAPIAATMGFSIEDVTTAITAMSMAGIKGSQAGTSLRTMFARMVKPTDNVATAMDELGIVLTNSDGSFKSMNTIIGEMRGKFDGMTDEQKTYYATVLAGQEGMSGLLSLLNLSQEEYDAISDSMNNAGGVAKETAEIMQDNLKNAFEQFGGSLESAAIKIGDIVLPKLTELVRKATDVVDKFVNASPEVQKFVLVLAGIAAAIGPVLLIFGKIAQTIANVIIKFNEFKNALIIIKAAFAGLAGIGAPMIIAVTAIIAIIALLVKAFTDLWNNNEEFRNNIIGIWNGIVESFENFKQGIVDRVNALGFDFENFDEMVRGIWQGLCDFLAPVFTAAFDTLGAVIETAFGVITGLFDIFAGLFTGNWGQLWQGVQEVFWSVWNGLGEIFGGILQAIVDAVAGFITSIVEWFAQLPGKIAEFIGMVLTAIGEWVVNLGQKAIELGTNFITAILNFFQQLPYNIGYIIGVVLASIVVWVTDMVNKAIELGTNFLQNIIDFFTQLPGNILNFITSAWRNVQTWATNMVNKAREMGTNFLNNVVSFFTQLPGRVAQFINDVFNRVVTWAVNMPNKAREMGSNFINNVVSFLSQLPGNVANFLSQAVSAAANWVGSMAAKGGEAISRLISAFTSGAAGIASRVMGIGSDIVSGVWRGIQNAVGWFTSSVRNFFSGIVDGVKNVLGIGSPSKVFANEVGQWLPAGVAVGFEEAMPQAAEDIQDSLDSEMAKVTADDVAVNPDVEVENFKNKLMQMYDLVADWFESIEERIGGSIDKMTQSMVLLINSGALVASSGNGFTNIIGYTNYAANDTSGSNRRSQANNQCGVNNYGPFVFNSPKAIDEITAAREFQKVQRNISEGY